MTDLCGLEFEGLENAIPGKLKTELRHFSRRQTTGTSAFSIALVPFCAACEGTLTGVGSNCPACQSRTDMVLRHYK